MSYSYTLDSFQGEAMRQWSQIAPEIPSKSIRIKAPKKEIKRAFEAYENAFKGPLPLIILGGSTIREELGLLKNFGSLATDSQVNQKIMKAFLKTTLNDNNASNSPSKLKKMLKSHVTQGAIICDSNWWIFRNDAFMLGGIHAGKEFHVVSKSAMTNDQIWDRENGRLTVLGRELTMLILAGYTRVNSVSEHKFGMIFQPPCDEEKRRVTLTQCREKIASLNSIEEITQVFNITIRRSRARTI